jgi:indolepyruvate ferredoxin oxidoreductase alpha subunit
MGASVGMARGAADAGYHPVVAVIGDSTFLHSGVTPLMDAVAADTPMTLIILDNKTVAMTGGQPTIRTSSELEALVRGLGVPSGHLHARRGPSAADGGDHRDPATRGQPPRPVRRHRRARVHRDRQAQQAGEDRGCGRGVTTMKFDIILAGVGGQGVLSVSAIIASSAMKEGLAVKQSEVHSIPSGGAVFAPAPVRPPDCERPDFRGSHP